MAEVRASTKRPAARRTRKPCRGEQTFASAQEQGLEQLCPGRPCARRQAAGAGPLPHALVPARQDGGGVGGAGPFRNPELLAYHKPGLPALALYKVRFKQRHLWSRYAGPASDHLEADIYEHWLEPAK